MSVYYRISHSGETIAMAGTIDQARAIVKESRPGSYHIVEVRDDPNVNNQVTTRPWGEMIRPDDSPVILDPINYAGSQPV